MAVEGGVSVVVEGIVIGGVTVIVIVGKVGGSVVDGVVLQQFSFFSSLTSRINLTSELLKSASLSW